MNYAKEYLIERSRYYESNHSLRLYDIFVVDIYYHKSCYIKWTINPIRKSDKNPNKNENKSKYSTL